MLFVTHVFIVSVRRRAAGALKRPFIVSFCSRYGYSCANKGLTTAHHGTGAALFHYGTAARLAEHLFAVHVGLNWLNRDPSALAAEHMLVFFNDGCACCFIDRAKLLGYYELVDLVDYLLENLRV